MYPELNTERPDWQRDANCRHADLELFFVDRGGVGNAGSADACKVCDGCPVATDCLEYAIENNIQHGVWGGLTVRSRRNVRRQWLASGRLERVSGGGARPVVLRLVSGSADTDRPGGAS